MRFNRNTIHTYIAILLTVLVAGCTDVKKEEYIVPSINTRILIISGESLNSVHDDYRINDILFKSTSKFSNDLRKELRKRGAVVIERFNNDHNKSTGRIIGELLAEINFDAVIQVSLIHEKNDNRNKMDLNVSYIPLEWTNNSSGESAVRAVKDPTKTYKDIADASLSQLALKYTKSLISDRVF